jgi:hydroxyacylglutathione hydrolase
MLLRRIFDSSLAQAAYLVGCPETREAIVIDPACDIDRYLAIAETDRLRIVAVAETHLHSDFVSGACGFASHHPVTVYLSSEGRAPDWTAGTRLAEGAQVATVGAGDAFGVGTLRFIVRHTPGHSAESLSFELARPGASPLLFSGDFLFAGGVGRVDLGSLAEGGLTVDEAVERLRGSIAALEDLPAETEVLPGHGQGTECGMAICRMPATTLGIERVINRAIRAQAEGRDLGEALAKGAAAPPPYFARVRRLNAGGSRAIARPPQVAELDAAAFAPLFADPSMIVVDTRPWHDYLDLRLPHAISAPFERSFGPTVANYLEEGDRVVLVAPRAEVEAMVRVLLRVGVAPDAIAGFVEPTTVARLDDDCFADAGAVDEIAPVAAHALVESGDAQVVDVRTAGEFAQGHLVDARHIPFIELRARADELDPDRPVLCYCRSGNRSARAAGYLASRGFTAYSMRGGYWPYAGRGYATEGDATAARAGERVQPPAPDASRSARGTES